MKKLSCGFVITDKNTGKLLGCHPYGRKDNLCDIPKGGFNEGETPLETALRELYEETGMKESELSDIKEIGICTYNKDKDLYIFTANADIHLENLYCRSFFELNGDMVPEMVRYELGDSDMYFHNLKKLIDKYIIY